MKINERASAGKMRILDSGSARARVASPPAGTALAPQTGIASRAASDWARFDSVYVTEKATVVNGKETKYPNEFGVR
jgi:hypothetical protein